MLTEIKNLELIGQSISRKQHGTLSEMLAALGMENDELAKLHSKEYVCIMAPDDDDDDADDTESE